MMMRVGAGTPEAFTRLTPNANIRTQTWHSRMPPVRIPVTLAPRAAAQFQGQVMYHRDFHIRVPLSETADDHVIHVLLGGNEQEWPRPLEQVSHRLDHWSWCRMGDDRCVRHVSLTGAGAA